MIAFFVLEQQLCSKDFVPRTPENIYYFGLTIIYCLFVLNAILFLSSIKILIDIFEVVCLLKEKVYGINNDSYHFAWIEYTKLTVVISESYKFQNTTGILPVNAKEIIHNENEDISVQI